MQVMEAYVWFFVSFFFFPPTRELLWNSKVECRIQNESLDWEQAKADLESEDKDPVYFRELWEVFKDRRRDPERWISKMTFTAAG